MMDICVKAKNSDTPIWFIYEPQSTNSSITLPSYISDIVGSWFNKTYVILYICILLNLESLYVILILAALSVTSSGLYPSESFLYIDCILLKGETCVAACPILYNLNPYCTLADFNVPPLIIVTVGESNAAVAYGIISSIVLSSPVR